MAKDLDARPSSSYIAALAMLALALAFPIALMVFNPTLMFQRGWEQYVGTAIYFWAVLTLARELGRLWRDERAFDQTPGLLRLIKTTGTHESGDEPEARKALSNPETRSILGRRVHQLAVFLKESRRPTVSQLMEVNRESSGLDQEQMVARFTLTRYILYLLPVIGFIGTVEGISKALMNISKVLPLVRDLDAFLGNLTSVTAALQIAFDSTLLALFLSAALMLVQTLVHRRSEDLLARVDRWIVDHALPRVGMGDSTADQLALALAPRFDEMAARMAEILAPAVTALQAQADSLGDRLAAPITQFTQSVQLLPRSLESFERGALQIARIGSELESLAAAGEALRQGSSSLARIEALLDQAHLGDERLDEIKRGIERSYVAVESLAGSWSAAYERSSRATQEQLARSLNSLRDALELLNVSMEQGNALYRNIVKKLFDERAEPGANRGDSIRVA